MTDSCGDNPEGRKRSFRPSSLEFPAKKPRKTFWNKTGERSPVTIRGIPTASPVTKKVLKTELETYWRLQERLRKAQDNFNEKLKQTGSGQQYHDGMVTAIHAAQCQADKVAQGYLELSGFLSEAENSPNGQSGAFSIAYKAGRVVLAWMASQDYHKVSYSGIITQIMILEYAAKLAKEQRWDCIRIVETLEEYELKLDGFEMHAITIPPHTLLPENAKIRCKYDTLFLTAAEHLKSITYQEARNTNVSLKPFSSIEHHQ